jgi:hypothetical protein
MYAPWKRDRSRSGTSAWKIEPAAMSSSMTPSPEPNSARNSIARTTGLGPPAAGTSSSGAGNRTQPAMNAGPIPIRRATRPVTIEPACEHRSCSGDVGTW